MSSTHVGLLQQVFTLTERTIVALTGQDLNRPTPCTDYDVRRLRDHLIGWSRVFGAYLTDEHAQIVGSPTYRCGSNPVDDYRHASASIIGGLSCRGDRPVVKDGIPIPPSVVTVEILAEHLIHCWDLAAATGQPIAFTRDQIEVAEIGLSSMLTQPYAPEGFRPAAPRTTHADGLSRLLARSGRDVHDMHSSRPGGRRP